MKKLFSALSLVALLSLGATQVSFAEDLPEAAAATVEQAADVATDAVAVATDAAAAVVAPAEAAPAEAPAAEAAPAVEPTVNKGDTTWMMISTVLVMLMVPGLALFYGGLVRAKNMLSVLMQVLVVFSLISVLWALYGYSLAFGSGSGLIIGDLGKAFLAGVTPDSLADTFSDGVKIPEMIFIAFQCTFAGLTTALIVGSFAERMKFSAVLLFSALWFTLSYIPIAHMVWGVGGYLLGAGALDFAGGTVVHINAAVAGLVGAYMVGKRIGYGKEALTPHNLTFTMVGAALLWVGWFGFNAGSNLEATVVLV
jgi:Amt family ammonium transporter